MACRYKLPAEAKDATKDIEKVDAQIAKMEDLEELECLSCTYKTKDRKRMQAHRKLIHKRQPADPRIRGDGEERKLRIVESAVNCKVRCTSPRKTATGIYLSNGRIRCETAGCACGNVEKAVSDFVLECADDRLKRQFESIWVTVTGVEKEVCLKELFLQELDDANRKAPNPFQDAEGKRTKVLRFKDAGTDEWRQGQVIKESGPKAARVMEVRRTHHGHRECAPAIECVTLKDTEAFISTTVVACMSDGGGLAALEAAALALVDAVALM